MKANKQVTDNRWKELLASVEFEAGDRGIFDIQDPHTRVRALRRYFFPKLNLVLNSARSLIGSIYGNHALDVFTEAQRPKPKENAESITSFNDVHLGLVGIRVESGLALRGSNRQPVQYGISHLWFEVMRRGTIAVTFLPMVYGKDPGFFDQVSSAFQDYEEAFCTVCGATFVTSTAYMTLDTFSASISPEHLRNGRFFSRETDFPVDRHSGMISLVATFGALFPFQKLVTDLSMSRTPTIDADLDALASWWETNGAEIFCPGRFGVERASEAPVESILDWESDQRVMVTGSQRFRVLDRDNYKCLACGRGPDTHGVALHVDHIRPRSKGGTDDDDNLQTLCVECNTGKGNRSSRDLRVSGGS